MKKMKIRLVEWVTIDARTIDPMKEVYVWKSYNERHLGTVGSCKHGVRVKLLKREGNKLFIETKNGKQGWITDWFTKEYSPTRREVNLV